MKATEASQHDHIDPVESKSPYNTNIIPRWSESMISLLPEDIIATILVKLRAKSLLRFKSISRGIRDLIRSPDFVAAHTNHHSASSTGLFLLCTCTRPRRCVAQLLPAAGEEESIKNSTDNNNNIIRSFSLPFLKDSVNPKMQFIGSCNGLVCLLLKDESSDTMLLWNPATSEFTCQERLRSCYDGTETFGFGYDPISGDYKTIRVGVDVDGTIECEVLSWGKRSWKQIEGVGESLWASASWNQIGVLRAFFTSQHVPVTTPGKVTWIVCDWMVGDPHDDDDGMAISFRLDVEEFELVPPQAQGDEKWRSWRIERDMCIWKGSPTGEHMPRAKDDPLFKLQLSLEKKDGEFCLSKRFGVPYYYRSPSRLDKPAAIWSTGGGDRSNSFLNYWNGSALDSRGDSIKPAACDDVTCAFEFTETLVPVPGSN